MIKRLGEYYILEHLASGGWADVYRVAKLRHDGSPAFFSMKILSSEMSEDRTSRAMFMDEAHLLALLNHNSIFTYQELVQEDGDLAIVLKYGHGRDLRLMMNGCKKAAFPVRFNVVCHVLDSIMQALEYIHNLCCADGVSLQVVHLDVNPKNIFLCFDGSVKIVDFGVARCALGRQDTESSKTNINGKTAYMSPEQMAGDDVDKRADIFAVGLVVYEMLAEEPLFAGESQSAIIKSAKNRDIVGAVNLLKIDDMVKEILKKLLARDPSSRYQDMLEARRDLKGYLRIKNHLLSPYSLQQMMQKMFPGEKENEKKKIKYFTELMTSCGFPPKKRNE